MLKLANIRQGQTIYRVFQDETGKLDIMRIFIEGVYKPTTNKNVVFVKTNLSASGWGDVGNHNRHDFFNTLNKAKRYLNNFKRAMLNQAKDQVAEGISVNGELPSNIDEKDLIMISVDPAAEEFIRKGFKESWINNDQLNKLITGESKNFVYGEYQLVLDGNVLLLQSVDTATNEPVEAEEAV